jgi:hypothetical protein
MLISRPSVISGQMQSMDLPIDADQLTLIGKGYLISDVCPNLTTEQVEFLLYGVMPGDIAQLDHVPTSGETGA